MVTSLNAEFMLDFSKVPGAITPRLYVPSHLTQLADFHSWLSCVRIIDTKFYRDGSLILWFSTSIDECCRLSSTFPHSETYHRQRTSQLLAPFYIQNPLS